jgi:kynureninase
MKTKYVYISLLLASQLTLFRQAGWWGHDPLTRFDMPPQFSPILGAQGFQQSNPSVLATVSLIGSLQIFKAVGGVRTLRIQSVALTGFLERRLKASKFYVPITAIPQTIEPRFTIITPSEENARGAQLSLLFLPQNSGTMQLVLSRLKANGVIADSRPPDVIRLSPVPLYNIQEDCSKAVEVLNEAIASINATS